MSNENTKPKESTGCKHKNFTTDWNIGYDINCGGEEKQHRDRCNDCNCWRWHSDIIDWGDDLDERGRGRGRGWYKGWYKHYGKWITDGE